MHYLDILFVIIGDCIFQIPPILCFFDQMLWVLIFSLFVSVWLLIEGSYILFEGGVYSIGKPADSNDG